MPKDYYRVNPRAWRLSPRQWAERARWPAAVLAAFLGGGYLGGAIVGNRPLTTEEKIGACLGSDSVMLRHVDVHQDSTGATVVDGQCDPQTICPKTPLEPGRVCYPSPLVVSDGARIDMPGGGGGTRISCPH